MVPKLRCSPHDPPERPEQSEPNSPCHPRPSGRNWPRRGEDIKIWAETLNGMDLTRPHVSLLPTHVDAFDPRGVPQSGGVASRLLSGIVVKYA